MPRKEQDSPLLNLPAELLLHVLGNLPYKELRRTFAALCHDTHAIVAQEYSDTLFGRSLRFNAWQLQQLEETRKKIDSFKKRHTVTLFNQPQANVGNKITHYGMLLAIFLTLGLFLAGGFFSWLKTFYRSEYFQNNKRFREYLINPEYAQELTALINKGMSVSYESKYFTSRPKEAVISQLTFMNNVSKVVACLLITTAIALFILRLKARTNIVQRNNLNYATSVITPRHLNDLHQLMDGNLYFNANIKLDSMVVGQTTLSGLRLYLDNSLTELSHSINDLNKYLTEKTRFASVRKMLDNRDIDDLPSEKLRNYTRCNVMLWSQQNKHQPLIREDLSRRNISKR